MTSPAPEVMEDAEGEGRSRAMTMALFSETTYLEVTLVLFAQSRAIQGKGET